MSKASARSCFAAHPDYQSVMRQLGALAKKLHGITLPAFGGIPAEGGQARHASNVDYMRGYVDGTFPFFLEHGGDPAMATTLRRLLERDFDAVVPQSGPAVFAHGDLQPHNVLVVERDGKLQLSGLIDYAQHARRQRPDGPCQDHLLHRARHARQHGRDPRRLRPDRPPGAGQGAGVLHHAPPPHDVVLAAQDRDAADGGCAERSSSMR